mmetsp:Transcript_150123/g.264958  ORF Transcript_150123/g.264958 Transcript_150123/m.264958 type:complete len:320 (-) Transcript_150123:264-1223(-)
MASMMKSSCGRCRSKARPFCSAAMAFAFIWDLVTWTCTKLELAAGSVFLNNSSASSLFKSLIVSAKATSSAARFLLISSHSAVFVSQSLFNSDRNFLSANRAASVSLSSTFIVAISTPRLPTRTLFFSMASVAAATSFFFAATRAVNVAIASSSAAVAFARSAAISSPSSFKMPVISPACGAYEASCVPWKKETSSSLSASGMSALVAFTTLSTCCATAVCRKLPAIPFSRAATAFLIAAMLEESSADNLSNSAFSLARIDSASLMAVPAASRSCLCCARSSFNCANLASLASISDPTLGTFRLAAPIVASRSATPFLQ